MIIIAFSGKTNKVISKIFCRKFKHCAPIIFTEQKYRPWTLIQFSHKNVLSEIKLSMRDLKILKKHGWRFICLDKNTSVEYIKSCKYASCVQLSKSAIGLNAPFIQTPLGLYKKIKNAHLGV